MRRSRTVSAAALLAGSALLLSACSGGDGGDDADEAGAKSGGEIVNRGCQPENPLVPGDTNETCGGDVVDALFTGLVEYDAETAEARNAMAESIETEDNKTFTVKVKEGWKFHDGTDVKAKNFVDAWNYTAYGPNGLQNGWWFEQVKGFADTQCEDPEAGCKDGETKAKELAGLKVVDDYTFTIETEAPFSVLPAKLGYTVFSPLPDSFFDDPDAFGRKPVGNGAFKFDSWADNQEIVTSKFADYVGEQKPNVDKVTFKHYQDMDAAYDDLLAGNLDFHDQIPTAALAGEKWKDDLADRAIEREVGIIQTVTLAPKFKGPGYSEFNKAVSLAVNREQITDKIFHGTYTPATGWVSPVVDGYQEDACGEWCTYDPDKAKDMLEEAKSKGFKVPKELATYYNADGDHKPWSEAFANQVSQVFEGEFKLVAKPYPTFAELRADVNDRKIDGFFRTGWQMDFPHIENFLNPLVKTGAASNDGLYSNKAVDDKLNEADAADSTEEATKLYQDAEKLLADDMPNIPMWYYGLAAGHSEKVENVKVTPFGTLDLYSISVK
ncbi:MAG: ABC transporter substrate-binding protein [Actinophytocola sp.]|nr:ABC transporter substrate-binding protein [Actinophytocola sp.]